MKRLGSRKGHFFSPSMLDSQLDTLEPYVHGSALEKKTKPSR